MSSWPPALSRPSQTMLSTPSGRGIGYERIRRPALWMSCSISSERHLMLAINAQPAALWSAAALALSAGEACRGFRGSPLRPPVRVAIAQEKREHAPLLHRGTFSHRTAYDLNRQSSPNVR